MKILGSSIGKNSLILGAFALITAAVLATTQSITAPRIAEAERKAAAKALLEIIPADQHDNDMLLDTFPIPESSWEALGLKDVSVINIARLEGQPVAAILPAIAPDGYSGDIKLIVGIRKDGTVAGVRILTHNETPGLGDKVDLKKSDWVLGFEGKSLANPMPERWTVSKDGGEFDQFTGATITPRAVVLAVRRALETYEALQPLSAKPLSTQPSPEKHSIDPETSVTEAGEE